MKNMKIMMRMRRIPTHTDAAEGEDDGEALDSSAYSQYMRPENAQAPKAEEEVKPLSRRERRMFFEGDENGEDDA